LFRSLHQVAALYLPWFVFPLSSRSIFEGRGCASPPRASKSIFEITSCAQFFSFDVRELHFRFLCRAAVRPLLSFFFDTVVQPASVGSYALRSVARGTRFWRRPFWSDFFLLYASSTVFLGSIFFFSPTTSQPCMKPRPAPPCFSVRYSSGSTDTGPLYLSFPPTDSGRSPLSLLSLCFTLRGGPEVSPSC